MTLKTNTAESGLTAGTAATTSNTGPPAGDVFAAVSPGAGGTITFESDQVMHGSLSYKSVQATAATNCSFRFDDTAANAFTVRFYLRLTGWPSTVCQFPLTTYTSADAAVCRLHLNTDGTIAIVATSASPLATTGSALALNTWYRIEYYGTLNASTGALSVDVYAGDSLSTYTTAAATGVATGTNLARMRFGKFSSATLAAWYIDDIAMNIGSSTPLGPASTPADPGGWGIRL